MQTLATTTALLLASIAFARAESTVVVQPIDYMKLQKDIRASANACAEQAQTMARLSSHSYGSAQTQRVQAMELKDKANEVIESASKLALLSPYEVFNSADGSQLQLGIARLAATTQATIEFLKTSPNRIQAGEYQGLLQRIQDICVDLAD